MKRHVKKTIVTLALISLVAAYAVGFLNRTGESQNRLSQNFPGMELQQLESGKDLYAVNKNGETVYYVTREKQQGWGGPLETAVVISPQGDFEKVMVLSSTETPSFFRHIVNNGFFNQFEGLKSNSPIKVGTDIDAISGATISSKALTKATRIGAHRIGSNILGQDIKPEKTEFLAGKSEFFLIALMASAVILRLTKRTKARPAVLAVSMIFIGFVTNRSISLSNFGSLLLGFIPSIYEQPLWWVLLVGTLLITIILSMNLYCFWMCPFGAIQEFITKFGGLNVKVSPKIEFALKTMVYTFVWAALMITFLTGNPAVASFEPFSTLFSLKGLAVQWYLVSLALVGSFFIPRFWCRFFCPAGAILNLIVKVRKGFFKGKNLGKSHQCKRRVRCG